MKRVESEPSLPPVFSKDEVFSGRFLGAGEFGVVNEVAAIRLKSMVLGSNYAPNSSSISSHFTKSLSYSNTSSRTSEDGCRGDTVLTAGATRESMFRHCLRGNDEIPRYALKKMRNRREDHTATADSDLHNSGDKESPSQNDLSRELTILCLVSGHPNIIKLRGKSIADPSDRDFFIIIDRLYETLDRQLTVWENKRKQYSKSLSRVFKSKKFHLKKQKLTQERHLALQDLASALAYLHGHRVIYRDLKPENIGFDIRGTLKLFDFNLSRELPRSEERAVHLAEDDGHDDSSLYQMTFCGNLGFMAPEVLNHNPYNLKADVYSYGMMIYTIASLKQPFGTLGDQEMTALGNNSYRPCLSILKNSWEIKGTVELIRKCWSVRLEKRPTMKAVKDALALLIIEWQGDTNKGINRSEEMLNLSIKSLADSL